MSYGLTTFLGFDRGSCVAVFSIQGQKALCVMVHTVGRNEEHGDEDLTQNNSLYFKQGKAYTYRKTGTLTLTKQTAT